MSFHPPMLDTAITWFDAHRPLASALGGLSLLLLATSVLAAPRLVARLPRDYFSAPRAPLAERGVRRWLLLVARNLAGLLFMVLGAIMLVTPGPGLIGLLLGLSLCEFPGKHALVRAFAARPNVFASLNWLRRRAGTTPFVHPVTGEATLEP